MEGISSSLRAGTAAALTNGTQQQSTPAALQPLAEALSKAEAASQRAQAAAPPRQVHFVSLLCTASAQAPCCMGCCRSACMSASPNCRGAPGFHASDLTGHLPRGLKRREALRCNSTRQLHSHTQAIRRRMLPQATPYRLWLLSGHKSCDAQALLVVHLINRRQCTAGWRGHGRPATQSAAAQLVHCCARC